MKPHFILLLMVALLHSPGLLFSQYVFEAICTDPTAMPLEGQVFCENPEVHDFLIEYGVIEYYKLLPELLVPIVSLENYVVIVIDTALMNPIVFEELFNVNLSAYFCCLVSMGIPELASCESPVSISDYHDSLSFEVMDLFCAWNITKGNPRIKVCVSDIDADLDHPDLAGQYAGFVLPDRFFLGTGGCPIATNIHLHPPNHGTAMGGLIAGKHNNGYSAGVAPNTKLVTSEGFNYGMILLATEQFGVRVANMSWRNTWIRSSEGSHPVVDSLRKLGVLLFASAMNDPRDTNETRQDIFYPCGLRGVNCVTTVTNNTLEHGPTGKRHHHLVDFCVPVRLNASVPIPHVAAFDTSTQKCDTVGTNVATGVNFFGSTSSATAAASGVAALILSINPCLTPDDVEYIMKTTAVPAADEHLYPGMLGAGVINAYEACSLALVYPHTPSKDVSSNMTIDGPTILYGEIRVRPNATLTLNDGFFYCQEFTRIIVEPGGTLVMNNAQLTTIGNWMWEGVQVLGNATLSQSSANQGRVVLNSGSSIQNAHCGVRLGKYIAACGDVEYFLPANYAAGTGGGIIQANGAIIRNCRRGIEFAPYDLVNNVSVIQNCTFENTQPLKDAAHATRSPLCVS